MKIEYLFVRPNLRDIYPHSTKWQIFKYHTANGLRRLFIVSLIVSGVFGFAQAYRYSAPIVVMADREVLVDNLGKKVTELKAEIVETLRQCESSGHSEDDGIIVFDSNGQASIGNWQFQKKTVIHYYQKLYGLAITQKEAVLIALDDKKAATLTEKILFEVENGQDEWYNCSKKLGLKTWIEIIKKLQ